MRRESLMRLIEKADDLDTLKAAISETRKKVRDAKRSRRARSASRPPRAAGASKEDRKAARKERLSGIVASVRARSDGDCQTCGNPGHDAHHVASGPARRLRESTGTMLWLCRTCHRLWHDGNVEVLISAATYCHENGLREAEAVIYRRLNKIIEAQASRSSGGGETP